MKTYIYGKNAVKEAINAKRNIEMLFVQTNHQDIITLAQRHHITYKIVSAKQLDDIVNGLHQGVVAEVPTYHYFSIEEMIANPLGAYPLIVMLDGIEDPHNLGAILRTCDACGVDGVIIPKHRSVGLGSTVAKVSTGAIEHVKVAQVTNLTTTLKELKNQGFWIVGADANEKSVAYTNMDYRMPTVLVLGSEGKGISRLVQEQCDFIVHIPMFGYIHSLNVSVACGVILYQIINQRKE